MGLSGEWAGGMLCAGRWGLGCGVVGVGIGSGVGHGSRVGHGCV